MVDHIIQQTLQFWHRSSATIFIQLSIWMKQPYLPHQASPTDLPLYCFLCRGSNRLCRWSPHRNTNTFTVAVSASITFAKWVCTRCQAVISGPWWEWVWCHSTKYIIKFKVLALQCFLWPLLKITGEQKPTAQKLKASVTALVFQYNRTFYCRSKIHLCRWHAFLRGWCKNALPTLPTLPAVYPHPPEKCAITNLICCRPKCRVHFLYLALSNKYITRCTF